MPKHIPSSGSRRRDQSRESNRSHQPGAAAVSTRSNTGEVSDAVVCLNVLQTTRLILRDEEIPGDLGRVDQATATNSNIAACIQQLTRRLVAEADRTDEEGADARQMWESVLRLGRATLETIPSSLAGSILQFCWTELNDLRDKNRTHRRCSCFSAILDSETQRCRSTHQPNRPLDPGEELGEDLAEPIYMDGNYIREESHDIIVACGRPYASVKPVHQSVTAGIWDVVVPAQQRAIIEIADNTQPECIATWQAIHNERAEAIDQQDPNVLAVILASAWADVISIRCGDHFREGRCSHYGTRAMANDTTPLCGVGERFGLVDLESGVEPRDS